MQISDYYSMSIDKNMRLGKIRDFVKMETDIAYITSLEKSKEISDRFIDKIIDIVSRYEAEELKTLFHCTFLVLNDMERKDQKLRLGNWCRTKRKVA
jgi:hypothetical protein